MKTSLQKSLKNYLLTSGAVLGAATAADAQSIRHVVVNEVFSSTNPDYTYDTLDLDNDGIGDLQLLAQYTRVNGPFASGSINRIRLMDINSNANTVYKSKVTGTGYPRLSTKYEYNDAINLGTSMFSLAYIVLYKDITNIYNSNSYYNNGNFDDVMNKYFVFTMEKVSTGQVFKGFFRIDVGNNGYPLTVHEYAIETVVGAITYVGQGATPLSVATPNAQVPQLWVNNNNELASNNAIEGTLSLTDMTGAEVYAAPINGTTTTLPVLAPGVYIARISRQDGVLTEKVVIR